MSLDVARFPLRDAITPSITRRLLSSSSSAHADQASTSTDVPRDARLLRANIQEEEDRLWDIENVEEEDQRHMSSWGWEIFHQQKEFFDRMRLLERDVPRFEKYRRPFIPPNPNKTSVLVRSVTYAGELHHPVTPKRVIVVPISKLQLRNADAIHNIKVIAGPLDFRKLHEPVYASKATSASKDIEAEHGYQDILRIVPEGPMNLKWCMDTLRKLVSEANARATSSSPDSFTDIPLPTRHHDSRLRSHGRGGGSYKAERRRVTLADFPKEWLPSPR
ncbi:SubName: Full=Uncharacterized protein {ECO:0000313/EMBL:CCA73172.1} [Serendipita indica DSM 11827]|nr:SubName: Full=Uncharacterized protein {ECO:0000313/EMBL:CCA73172.1} [Serendipita indica DSM 11827]